MAGTFELDVQEKLGEGRVSRYKVWRCGKVQRAPQEQSCGAWGVWGWRHEVELVVCGPSVG